MKKQKMVVRIETEFLKPVVGKVADLLKYKFHTEANVKNYSFGDAAYQEVCFYYVASDEINEEIQSRIKLGMGGLLEIVTCN